MQNDGMCKHSLALLMARLKQADWVAAGGDATAAEQQAAVPSVAPAAAAGAAAEARAAAAAGGQAASQGSSQGPRKRKLPSILTAPK